MLRQELLEYLKTERSRFAQTRNIQWKVNIGFWTLLILAIWFLDRKKIDCHCWVWLATFIFLAAHFIFALLTQKGLAASRKFSDSMMDALDAEKNETFVSFDRRRVSRLHIGFYGWLWIILQMMPTISLIIILILKINTNPQPPIP